jgi:hypothetical protein
MAAKAYAQTSKKKIAFWEYDEPPLGRSNDLQNLEEKEKDWRSIPQTRWRTTFSNEIKGMESAQLNFTFITTSFPVLCRSATT